MKLIEAPAATLSARICDSASSRCSIAAPSSSMICVSTGKSLGHCDDIARVLLACFKHRGTAQSIPQTVARVQVVLNAVNRERERSRQQHQMMLMVEKSRTLIRNTLMRLDGTVDHLKLQLPAWRRKRTPRETVFTIQPDTLIGMPNQRRKIRLKRRQKLRKRQHQGGCQAA